MKKSQIFLLLAIKSASIFKKEKIQILLKKLNLPFLILLYKYGIIQNFLKLNITFNKTQLKFLIYLRYFFNKPVCKNLKLLSKPSLCIALRFIDICLLYDKKHTLFFSTSQGIITNLECKIKHLGGNILFSC